MAVLQWLVMPFSFELENCETGQTKEVAQMKKLLVLCTAILLMLSAVVSAVGCQQQAEPTPAPTTPPAPEAQPEPAPTPSPAPSPKDMPILPTRPPAARLFVVIPFGYPIADEDLDGSIGVEWSGSIFSEIEMATDDGLLRFPATLYMKHDGTFLYIGVRLQTDMPLTDIEVFVATDVSGNGELYDMGDNLDDLWVAESDGELVSHGIDRAYGRDRQFAPDTDFGGTEDAKAAAKFTDGVLSAEFCRPLDSGDRLGNDPRFELGDEVEIGIGVAAAGSKRFDVTCRITAKMAQKGFFKLEETKELSRYLEATFFRDTVVFTEERNVPVIKVRWMFATGWETFYTNDFKATAAKMKMVNHVTLPDWVPRYMDSQNRYGVDLDGDGKVDMVRYRGDFISVVKVAEKVGKEEVVREKVKARIKATDGTAPKIVGEVGAVPSGSVVTIRDKHGHEVKVVANADGSFTMPDVKKHFKDMKSGDKLTVIVQHVTGWVMREVAKEEGGGFEYKIMGRQYEWKMEVTKGK